MAIPPTRADGYRWICHTLARSEQVRQMIRELPADARYDLIHRDIGPLGWTYDADVEVWAHPDDVARVAPVACALLRGD
jgi:hypothetical protein